MTKAQILSAQIDDRNRTILTNASIPDKEVWGVIDYRTATLMSVYDEMSHIIQQTEQTINQNAVIIFMD